MTGHAGGGLEFLLGHDVLYDLGAEALREFLYGGQKGDIEQPRGIAVDLMLQCGPEHGRCVGAEHALPLLCGEFSCAQHVVQECDSEEGFICEAVGSAVYDVPDVLIFYFYFEVAQAVRLVEAVQFLLAQVGRDGVASLGDRRRYRYRWRLRRRRLGGRYLRLRWRGRGSLRFGSGCLPGC